MSTPAPEYANEREAIEAALPVPDAAWRIKVAGEIIRNLSRVVPSAGETSKAAPDAEAVAEVLIDHLERLHEEAGVQPWCEAHGREHVTTNDDGIEFCRECAADGASGELVHFHPDSAGFELAEKVMKLFAPAPTPAGGEVKA